MKGDFIMTTVQNVYYVDCYVGNFVSRETGKGQPFYRVLLKLVDEKGGVNFALSKCTKSVYEQTLDIDRGTQLSNVYYDKYGRISLLGVQR